MTQIQLKRNMENSPINYEAVLKDLETRRSGLDKAIEAIKNIIAQGGSVSASGEGSNQGENIESHTFFGMGIGDAAKKYLTMMRKPQSTKAIIEALERGGLTHTSKNFYGTVFTVLSRREKNEGDVVKVKKDWGLTEWFPGMRKPKKNGDAIEEPSSEEPDILETEDPKN